jgi:hypothetical protein
MNFGDALTLVKNGHKMTRIGWNGRDMWIEIQRPDTNSKMTLPYLFLNYPHGDKVPWLASQTDMLQDDWMIYEEPEKTSFTLNVNQVEAMKRAGIWKNPVKRKQALEGYNLAWKAVQTEELEKPKKPHWTQTPEGKKKIAARKKRGWKK